MKEKRSKPKRKSYSFILILISLFAVAAIVFLANRLIYLLLLAGAAMLHYFMYMREIKINLGHVFFLSLAVTRGGNFAAGIMFLLVGGLFTELAAGYVESKTFVAYPLAAAYLLGFVILKNSSFFWTGLAIAFLYYVTLFFAATLLAEPFPERIFEIIVPMILTFVYFMVLGGLLR